MYFLFAILAHTKDTTSLCGPAWWPPPMVKTIDNLVKEIEIVNEEKPIKKVDFAFYGSGCPFCSLDSDKYGQNAKNA